MLAGEVVRADDVEANPDVEPLEVADGIQTLPLASLVRIKLNSFRENDRVHLRDMISLDMIDKTGLENLPATLADRLKQLLDDPYG